MIRVRSQVGCGLMAQVSEHAAKACRFNGVSHMLRQDRVRVPRVQGGRVAHVSCRLHRMWVVGVTGVQQEGPVITQHITTRSACVTLYNKIRLLVVSGGLHKPRLAQVRGPLQRVP